jgi:hypothetical protein
MYRSRFSRRRTLLLAENCSWMHASARGLTAPAHIAYSVRNSMGHAASRPQPAADWTPAVLTEYEIGRAIWAAEAVARSEKTIAEVGTRPVDSLDALESDLRECLKLVHDSEDVRFWTRPAGETRVRYGFYREAWALGALDFLDRTELASADRAWISGLLFGYRADAIQQFINRSSRRPKRL